jgi:hypothetical protein
MRHGAGELERSWRERAFADGNGDAAFGRRRGLDAAVGDPTGRDDRRDRAPPSDVIAAHGGVRPVEQGEGDSFVAAFGARVGGGGRCPGVAAGTVGPEPAAHRGCIPARCSCAMRATTPAQPSTEPRGWRSGPRRSDRAVGSKGFLANPHRSVIYPLGQSAGRRPVERSFDFAD